MRAVRIVAPEQLVGAGVVLRPLRADDAGAFAGAFRNIERGRRVDVVWFGVLREEWNSRR